MNRSHAIDVACVALGSAIAMAGPPAWIAVIMLVLVALTALHVYRLVRLLQSP